MSATKKATNLNINSDQKIVKNCERPFQPRLRSENSSRRKHLKGPIMTMFNINVC